jgi:hypothetical protein
MHLQPYARAVEEHMEHLRHVLQRFKEEGLKLRLTICASLGYTRWSILIISETVSWHGFRLRGPCLDRDSRGGGVTDI